MKNLFLGIVVLLAVAASATAQPRKPVQDKMEAYKIAFFTERLQLTPDESKNFWPLFNQFEKERDAIKAGYNLEGKKVELMSDKEVEDFIMQHFEMEEKLVKLRRDYVRRFMEALPIRKVALLQKTDQEFKRHLLEEIQRRRQEGVGPKRDFKRN